jgi:hypothetical protein
MTSNFFDPKKWKSNPPSYIKIRPVKDGWPTVESDGHFHKEGGPVYSDVIKVLASFGTIIITNDGIKVE